jgi:hypothetical protein
MPLRQADARNGFDTCFAQVFTVNLPEDVTPRRKPALFKSEVRAASVFCIVQRASLRCEILPIFNPNALLSPLSAAVAAFYIVESHGRHYEAAKADPLTQGSQGEGANECCLANDFR